LQDGYGYKNHYGGLSGFCNADFWCVRYSIEHAVFTIFVGYFVRSAFLLLLLQLSVLSVELSISQTAYYNNTSYSTYPKSSAATNIRIAATVRRVVEIVGFVFSVEGGTTSDAALFLLSSMERIWLRNIVIIRCSSVLYFDTYDYRGLFV